MKLLILNGPNLNLLGVREPHLYGKETYAALCDYLREEAKKRGMTCEIFQSNHEGVLIDRIQEAMGHFDGLILNAAGYTHTSVAIADAVAAVGLPTVEVHLTDIGKREDFRKHSFLTPVVKKTIMGKGFAGYALAMDFLAEWEKEKKA